MDQDGQLAFPSRAQAQLNFKILLNFHTEYILDQGGQFSTKWIRIRFLKMALSMEPVSTMA
ncbi:MAG: DUF3114 domain-containing protein [Streptococcus sp.]